MKIPNLRTEFLPSLSLRTPFGIASSHLTGDFNMIKALSKVEPSFITLKTTDEKYGGNGNGSRTFIELKCLSQSGTYFVDGPRTLELLNLRRTLKLLLFAKQVCPHTAIGVSVSIGENYEHILPEFETAGAQYVEVCLKYTARQFVHLLNENPPLYMQCTFDYVYSEVKKALQYTSLPILIKLARDIPWIKSHKYLQALRDQCPERLGFIIADTQKYLVYEKRGKRSLEGVITGSILFPETITIIQKSASFGITPIMASGGIMDATDAAHAISHGALAVQLCSTLQKNHISYFQKIQVDFIKYLQEGGYLDIQDLVNSKNKAVALSN